MERAPIFVAPVPARKSMPGDNIMESPVLPEGSSTSIAEAIVKCPVRWLYPVEYAVLIFLLLMLPWEPTLLSSIPWVQVFSWTYELSIVVLGAPFLLAAYFGYQCLHHRRGTRLIVRQIATQMRRCTTNWRWWLETLRIVVALKACLLLYCHLKQRIPGINPHLFDSELDAVDRWLHWGLSPVDISLAMFGQPWAASAIDYLYIYWYIIKAPVLLFFLLHQNLRTRQHFFLCYALMWLVGGSIAIALPSLGPVYVEPDKFAGLDAPYAKKLQDMLWTGYEAFAESPATYQDRMYEGIAAFPSLHVGIIVLFTLSLTPYRGILWLIAAYSVTIQIGSVVLGWHYAVDGYIGALLAATIFYGTRPSFAAVRGVSWRGQLRAATGHAERQRE